MEKEKVLEEKRHTTQKVSDLVRYIAFGLCAVVFGLFMSDSDFAETIVKDRLISLIAVGILGIATILSDYVQFIAGYLNVQEALENKGASYEYPLSVWHHTRYFCFWFKQTTAFLGGLVLLYTLAATIEFPFSSFCFCR